MTELKIHPTAARFPALPKDELEALAADIKTNKQRQPIMLTADGTMILDGVNRLNACKRAGVKPRFRRLPRSYAETDIIRYIISANLRRRDLNPGQKAMLALDASADFEKAAKERSREGGRKRAKQRREQRAGRKMLPPTATSQRRKPHSVRSDLAGIAGVAGSTIGKAKAIHAFSPSLAGRVTTGEISLADADRIMRREKTQKPDDGAPSKVTTIIITHQGKKADYPLPKTAPHFNLTNDQVSWAAYTWNPVTGCLHNCNYCYAREGIEVNENLKKRYPFGFTPTFFEYRLRAPTNTKLPVEARDDPRFGRVFVSSMGDLFGKWVPDDWIERVFAACKAAPWWEYLFLTKFPQRYVGMELPPTAWIGTTVDTRDRVRIAETAFRKIGGVRIKWLSCEPLLEPLKFKDLSIFDFVVIGSQSATKQPKGNSVVHVPEFAPAFEWVADLTAQAKAAGCKVYHKPNLLGIPNDQCAGMKLIQDVPDLPNLPARIIQGEMFEALAQ